jgi:uncharacterized RDD family membrane protein YckC
VAGEPFYNNATLMPLAWSLIVRDANMRADRKPMQPTTGVYFRTEDYASFPRRLMIDLIDALIVGCLCGVALLVFVLRFASKDQLLATWAAIFFCYFVLLKRSKMRTIGYRIGGVRIVGLDGKTPSLGSLTLRLLFTALGPLNYLLDIAFLSADPHRQALRDKLAQTYVVKKRAEPIGSGRLIYRYYEILGYNFLFREVPVGSAPDRSPDPKAATPQ